MRQKLTIAIMLVAALLSMRCVNTDSLESDIEKLKVDIAQLESSVAMVNSEISAIYALMNESTLIVGVTQTSTGYQLEMSNGDVVTIFDGANLTHTVPIIGINGDGVWIISTDGGATFSAIVDSAGDQINALPESGATGDEGDEGITPKVMIDAQGYWLISYDNGVSYDYLKDSSGNVVSATDASGGSSSFFDSVSWDQTNSILNIKLLTNEQLSLPIVSTFYLKIEGVEEEVLFATSEEKRFAVEQDGVEDAVITLPTGWSATLESDRVHITAPDSVMDDCRATI